ncbi:porin family protein [Maribellus maritimus]|uniref:porin family protein n=1 Tax=Maribellus maritimus TaxID=2870838 RepID=UPI001EE9AEFE|nr:porin family protein [Maribellus maritimus]MCG6187682.1 PorT family protein [Maribellus maritimus]
MKKLTVLSLLLLFVISVSAQPIFNLGLKAGLNNSKLTFKKSEINSETITKYHIGAFGRVGAGKIFVQPEAYFSAKGGELEGGNVFDVASEFDFNTVDVPLLLGIKVIDGEKANVRLMGGPVFSFLTSKDVDGDELWDPEYYKDQYIGLQYGIGADIFGFTLDFRMENSSNMYKHMDSDLNAKNQTFMISVGYKIF